MTDEVIKQANVYAILLKLNFLNFPSVTHQAVSEAEAWKPAALSAQQARRPSRERGLELI